MSFLLDLSSNLIVVTVGALIASTAYILRSFLFAPLIDFKGMIGEVHGKLSFYANLITSPGVVHKDKIDNASLEVRKLSSDLRVAYARLGFKPVLYRLGIIPPSSSIELASSRLIYISNSMHSGDPIKNSDALDRIAENLKFKKI